MQYVFNSNIRYDILLMSLGFDHVGYDDEVEYLCEEIGGMGTIIVFSFDNAGSMSYPTAIEQVIGVDIFKNIDNILGSLNFFSKKNVIE